MSTGLTPELLLQAYSVGIFPMAENRDDPTLYWIDPESRGIIPLDSFHIPRRLRRTLRQDDLEVHVDTAFAEVMDGCAAATRHRPNTWINEEIAGLYSTLHEMGRAHSVEVWQDGQLVGGLYGVSLGTAFFGESMFTRVRDASKVALVHLVARLVIGGFTLLDTQFLTEHLERFGAVEIPRDTYRALLAVALRKQGHFYSELDDSDFSAFLQSTRRRS
ncbi:MAG: leucyl/phenylalanyl-tRNA--protein transferase [Rhodospirillaceae bacterium]|jgi:leucyl/phenylalanyl-tRNA---protein transferase|nr:leucyl/phenylalanyl-tRNA--protein transferase [Rhodospirillaceae bacterium]MBT6118463.1 leucyl/phenylalanyl-tRNA--protein transferase [Rhodospirillaceae bacterium]